MISSPVDMLCSTVSAPFFLFVGHGVGQLELYAEKSGSAPDGELQQRQREDRHCIGADPTGKQAIKTVPLTESKGAAQARWMTPTRSNRALSILDHPIAKAGIAQRGPPSMPTIADHSPALQRNTPRL